MNLCMKTRLPPVLLSFLACISAPLAAQSLLLHYNFDRITGSTVPDLSGNRHDGQLEGTTKAGVPGSGPSGRSGDIALDNSAARMGEKIKNTGGAVRLRQGFGPLASFTYACWFRTDGLQSLSDLTRLLDFTGKGYDDIRVFYHHGYVRLDIGETTRVINGTHGLTDRQGEWVFFVITYDGTQTRDNVRFYIGSATIPLVRTATTSSDKGVINWGDSNCILSFGSDHINARSIDGWLDNIRIYGDRSGSGGALTGTALQKLMVADLDR